MGHLLGRLVGARVLVALAALVVLVGLAVLVDRILHVGPVGPVGPAGLAGPTGPVALVGLAVQVVMATAGLRLAMGCHQMALLECLGRDSLHHVCHIPCQACIHPIRVLVDIPIQVAGLLDHRVCLACPRGWDLLEDLDLDLLLGS